jgi:uncharacterized membrane protein YhaH (DUF805 family)
MPKGRIQMSSRFWTWLFVLIIPFLAIVGAFPFYNRAEPFILGFPFLYFWIFLWIVLTPLSMFIGYKLDPENKKEE